MAWSFAFGSRSKDASLKCTIPDHLCGIDGLVHEGILATLLDEVGEWAIISRLGRFGMTSEISIRYLKPVQTSKELLVEEQIISHDDRNGYLRGTIHSVDGALLTESESKWIFPSLSSIAKVAKVEESMLQEFLFNYSRRNLQKSVWEHLLICLVLNPILKSLISVR